MTMLSQSFSGVLYAEDFDAPEPATVVEEAPAPVQPVVIEPTFSLADLRRAADRAQEEGRASARRDTEIEASERRTAALLKLADALQNADHELNDVASQAASATAETVLAMIAALLPDFAKARGQDEATALLRLLLPAMAHEPQLVIRAHPLLVDGLREDLAGLLENGAAGVEWVASETMQPGDVAVRWQGGTMVRDVGALHAQIVALVMPAAKAINSRWDNDNGK